MIARVVRLRSTCMFLSCAALVACAEAELPPAATATSPVPATPRRYPTPSAAGVPTTRPVARRGPTFVGVSEEGVLPNGVRVRVYPDASLPVVSVAFVATRPPSPADTFATRSLFARAMLGATGSKTRQESFSALNYVATGVGHAVNDESIAWYFDTLEPLWITAFRRVAAMLSDPRFEADDLERDLVLCEQDLARSTAEAQLVRMLYGPTHPFAVPADPSCKGLTRAQIVAYRDRAFAPANLTVVVAGDVSFAQVMFEAKDDFVGLVDHGLAPVRPVPPVLASPERRVAVVAREGDELQAKVLLGFPAVGVSSPDLPALRVLAAALGGPLTGRLNTKVRRERGSSYGIQVSTESTTTTGTFVIRAAIAIEDAGASLGAMFAELEHVRTERLSTAELEAAKRSALMDISTRYAGPRAAMRDVMALEEHGLPHWGKLAQAIDVVGADDVRHVAEKYLVRAHVQAVLVGDPTKLDDVEAAIRK